MFLLLLVHFSLPWRLTLPVSRFGCPIGVPMFDQFASYIVFFFWSWGFLCVSYFNNTSSIVSNFPLPSFIQLIIGLGHLRSPMSDLDLHKIPASSCHTSPEQNTRSLEGLQSKRLLEASIHARNPFPRISLLGDKFQVARSALHIDVEVHQHKGSPRGKKIKEHIPP